ncbi:hypothetical protein PtA15_5A413 [Puccinia triticina]|uniref:Uncharacterized protein n=1 Tax=Puccinia triticina TaxID=208348 RepID=A0ABY7CJC8_9BASI|nr:uncharacterized protein PtA15_5A413 [Puccinia triticina]WAQ84840.1 hypothetical protein PtA15_5A413 [Puccinia triticina]
MIGDEVNLSFKEVVSSLSQIRDQEEKFRVAPTITHSSWASQQANGREPVAQPEMFPLTSPLHREISMTDGSVQVGKKAYRPRTDSLTEGALERLISASTGDLLPTSSCDQSWKSSTSSNVSSLTFQDLKFYLGLLGSDQEEQIKATDERPPGILPHGHETIAEYALAPHTYSSPGPPKRQRLNISFKINKGETRNLNALTSLSPNVVLSSIRNDRLNHNLLVPYENLSSESLEKTNHAVKASTNNGESLNTSQEIDQIPPNQSSSPQEHPEHMGLLSDLHMSSLQHYSTNPLLTSVAGHWETQTLRDGTALTGKGSVYPQMNSTSKETAVNNRFPGVKVLPAEMNYLEPSSRFTDGLYQQAQEDGVGISHHHSGFTIPVQN